MNNFQNIFKSSKNWNRNANNQKSTNVDQRSRTNSTTWLKQKTRIPAIHSKHLLMRTSQERYK
jgi:hypothetical protein